MLTLSMPCVISLWHLPGIERLVKMSMIMFWLDFNDQLGLTQLMLWLLFMLLVATRYILSSFDFDSVLLD